jgi:hypothetical protein
MTSGTAIGRIVLAMIVLLMVGGFAAAHAARPYLSQLFDGLSH